MSSKLVRTTYLGIVLLALLVFSNAVLGQEGAELINQLSGQAQVPARDAAQLTGAYQKAIDYLLPLMSAEDVGSRHNYQILLQDISAHASRPGAEQERLALAQVIVKTIEQAEMPGTVRAWLVRQLERIGKAEAVGLLTKLMASEDKHLRDYARQALEKNPDLSATDALLKALSTARDATWRIGLINALGTRRAQTAVRPIAAALDDRNVEVARAAVVALSQIGGRESVQALFGVLEKPDAPVAAKAAQGLVDMAQALAKAGETTGAARVYGALYDWATEMDSPGTVNIRAGTIHGLVLCDPDRGTREIVTLIQDDNPKLRTAAVEAARRSPSEAPTWALTRMLPELEPQSQAQVLSLIADRGKADSIEVVGGLLTSQDASVGLAAVDALSGIGTVAGAKRLMDIAVNGDGSTQKAATAGLAAMAGPDVESYIDAQAASGDIKARVVAIDVLGQRRGAGAAERLLGYAAETNDEINAASFDALTQVAYSVDVAALADLVAKARSNSVRAKGVAALKAVLAQAKDTDAAAQAVTSRMKTAEGAAEIALLTSLNAVGGAHALDAVREAVASSDEALRDAAIRTLSNWPDYEVASLLVDIAANDRTSLTHHVLTIRGALRLIGTSDSVPAEQRIALGLRALDQARRDEEKRQAIAILGVLPSQKVADRLLQLAQGESFKSEAGLAAVECAMGMLRTDRQAARDLAQKVRDMNISAEINQRANAVTSGRGMRGMRGFRRQR